MENLYYVWGRNTDVNGRWIDAGTFPYLEDVDGKDGKKVDKTLLPPLPFQLELCSLPSELVENPYGGEGPYMPAYMDCDMLLFRDDLIEALREIGVNNLELFDTVITDPDNGTIYTNYKAVNIVGSYSVADINKSIATVYGTPKTDVDFDKLVLNEDKIKDLPLLFYLEESYGTLLVHKKVKKHLLEKRFNEIAFYNPEEVAT
jgi:hypothetical protein